MSLKLKVKKVITRIAGGLASAGVIPKFIVINVDGGICSQMHMLLAGHALEQNGQKVVYNLDWFKNYGMDLNGKDVRNFDLLNAFPYLKFNTIDNALLKKIYHTAFYRLQKYGETNWLEFESPLWIDGYYTDSEEVYRKWFGDCFKVNTELLPADNKPVLRLIMNAEEAAGACAVHVRRGDLSEYNPVYGQPIEAEYLTKAIGMISEREPGTEFFVFSDGQEWCRKALAAETEKLRIHFIDVNGADRGWCDMFLMSRCRHIITSQGSLGKFAALLRDRERGDGYVIFRQKDYMPMMRDLVKNPVII